MVGASPISGSTMLSHATLSARDASAHHVVGFPCWRAQLVGDQQWEKEGVTFALPQTWMYPHPKLSGWRRGPPLPGGFVAGRCCSSQAEPRSCVISCQAPNLITSHFFHVERVGNLAPRSFPFSGVEEKTHSQPRWCPTAEPTAQTGGEP